MMIPVLATAVLGMLAGCSSPGAATADGRQLSVKDDGSITRAEDAMELAGTMHFIEVERGAWVIRSSDGTQYNPLKLPDEFRVEGLPVTAKLRLRDDIATTAMVGRPVEVVSIVKTGAAIDAGDTQ
jgi:hypothetical protein